MLSKVFRVLQADSRKGDFVDLSSRDKTELDIVMTDEEIEAMSKLQWKQLIKQKTKFAAFIYLYEENQSKEKTRDINFDKLKISLYLKENERTGWFKIIFSIRSKTLDIKEFHPWKYENNDMCVKCLNFPETMDHFATCDEYGTEIEPFWRDIYLDNVIRQKEIGKRIEKRFVVRQSITKKEEDGQASPDSGSSCSNL